MDKQKPINAYDLYSQALEIAVDVASPVLHPYPFMNSTQPVQRFVAIKNIKDYSRDQISEMLESNRESMTLIRKGLQNECHIPDMETGNTKLLQMTTVANLFIFEAWQQAEAHNIEGAIKCICEMMQFGVHLSNGGTYMRGMFCNKVIDQATKHLSTLIDESDADTALKACRMLQEFLDLSSVVTDAIEGEIRFSQASMNELFEQRDWKSSLSGDGDFLSTKCNVKKNKAWLKQLSQQDVISILDDLHTQMRLKATLPFQEAINLSDLPENRLTNMQSMVLNLRFCLLQRECYIKMLQIAFALDAYKIKNAGYPGDLESLVPEYLDNIPTDPFAESCPIKYIPDQKPYILYSVGPDGMDSKGKSIKPEISVKSKGDIVFEISAGEYPLAYVEPMPAMPFNIPGFPPLSLEGSKCPFPLPEYPTSGPCCSSTESSNIERNDRKIHKPRKKTKNLFADYLKPTRRMVLEPGDSGQIPVTKVGGVPWWPYDLPRPKCLHGHYMSFIAQTRLSDIPELGPEDPGLLSFHYCQECACEGDMPDGWMNPDYNQIDPDDTLRYDVRIFNEWQDVEPDGLGIIADDVLDPHIVTFSDRLETPSWDDIREIPELYDLAQDIPDEELEFMMQDAYNFDESQFPELVHIPVSKLGGWPSWVQHVEWPRDYPEEELIFVMQLSPSDRCNETWCNGLAYLFIHPVAYPDRKAKFMMQYT